LPGPDRIRWGLVIHGGVGVLPEEDLTPDLERAYREALTRSLQAGHAALQEGKAEDGVVEAIRVMEDSPLFNAGRGSNVGADGRVTMDASIMTGEDLAAGAVAEVTTVRNPIELARMVMEGSPNVFMVGAGAEAFARLNGIDVTPNQWFVTERRLRALEAAAAREAAGDGTPNVLGRPADVPLPKPDPPTRFAGTVGAVALDREGRICAGTSTGGMANKRFGRIGDSPVIGAGTYASDLCGVSCTGWGEYFIRNAVAHDVAARMAYLEVPLGEAVDQVIHGTLQDQRPGLGGLVALSRDGTVVMDFNTAGMYRGRMDQDGALEVGIY
jgi:beta-aspartyl-peptidase (threonine type)